MLKLHNFRGVLSDISAKTATLLITTYLVNDAVPHSRISLDARSEDLCSHIG